MPMPSLSTVRTVVFVLAILFAIVTLGLAGAWLANGELALSIVSGSMTIVILSVYMVIDIKRKGAFTSFNFVELLTVGMLWILWLSTSAAIARLERECAADFYCTHDRNLPHVIRPEVFAFLSFLNLFIYWSILLVLTLISQSHGHNPWTGSVRHTEFLAPRLPPKEPEVDLPVQKQDDSAQFVNPIVLHHNPHPPAHPGFPEPQAHHSSGLRTINSIASIGSRSTFPPVQDPSRWTSSSLPLPGSPEPHLRPPGLPEPQAVTPPVLRNVEIPASDIVSANAGLPTFQADTLYRFNSLITPAHAPAQQHTHDQQAPSGSPELDPVDATSETRSASSTPSRAVTETASPPPKASLSLPSFYASS